MLAIVCLRNLSMLGTATKDVPLIRRSRAEGKPQPKLLARQQEALGGRRWMRNRCVR